MALRTPALERPAAPDRPPFEADGLTARHSSDFDTLFDQLLTARRRYEDLRLTGGPIAERAALRNRLHTLRASIAAERAALTP